MFRINMGCENLSVFFFPFSGFFFGIPLFKAVRHSEEKQQKDLFYEADIQKPLLSTMS